MDFISLFAGIGGFDLGFEKAGMRSVAQVEWNDQATSVLKRHYPDALHLGDVTHVGKHNLPAARLICGGFPCTDVSIAGRRKGLAGKSSGFWFEFHRIIHEIEPEWVVIENVPGLLSSNDGKDFAVVLAGLTGIVPAVPKDGWGNAGIARGLPGLYHAAWRVLDAQYFGVAQRRRRVFIVASLGSGRSAEVLFEQYGSAGDFETGREARKRVTGISGNSTEGDSEIRTLNAWDQQNKRIHASDSVTPTLAGSDEGGGARFPYFALPQTFTKQRIDECKMSDVASTLAARDYKSATDLITVGTLAASGAGTARPAGQGNELDFVIPFGNATKSGIRRLTPREAERLQGFPDDWTAVDNLGKPIADTPRYRMLGNAVCANVAEWIGKRIVSASAALTGERAA